MRASLACAAPGLPAAGRLPAERSSADSGNHRTARVRAWPLQPQQPERPAWRARRGWIEDRLHPGRRLLPGRHRMPHGARAGAAGAADYRGTGF
ncbi:hypothetical protein G6F59_018155 [Rhizopus arrhizus]|nr:hypothetical protein G6F59_018155 [Rhizopus arrhizus]